MYSGFLESTPSGEKTKQHMHYIFYESEGNPATDPLLIWSNGGPVVFLILTSPVSHILSLSPLLSGRWERIRLGNFARFALAQPPFPPLLSPAPP